MLIPVTRRASLVVRRIMSVGSRTTNLVVVAGLTLLAAIVALCFLRANPGGRMVYDDSYITLTFARNLLNSGAFTFDGVHQGYGTTSPLHVILIAFGSLVFGRVETAALALGILTLALGGVFMYFWTREVTGRRLPGLLAGVLFVTSGWMIFDALSGLETVLFIMLLLLTFYLFERRSIWFGIPLGFSVMTRPDGWFFVAGLAVYALVQMLTARSVTRDEGRGTGGGSPTTCREQESSPTNSVGADSHPRENRGKDSPPTESEDSSPPTQRCVPVQGQDASPSSVEPQPTAEGAAESESVVVAPGVSVVSPASRVRPYFIGGGLFILTLLPFLTLNYLGTGSILPNTVMAKANFFGEMLHPLPVRWQFFSSGVRYFYTKTIMVMPWLILLGLAGARRFWRRWYLFVAIAGFYPLYLYLLPGGTAHYWFRYQHIFIPVALLAIAEGSLGVLRIADRGFIFGGFVRRFRRDPGRARSCEREIPSSISSGPGVVGEESFPRPVADGNPLPQSIAEGEISDFSLLPSPFSLFLVGGILAVLLTINQVGSIVQEYRRYGESVRNTEFVGEELARYLRENSQPGEAIATHDIGVLGYFAERPIIDLVGLVNPDAASLYRDPNTGRAMPFAERRTYWYLKAIRPRYLAMFQDWSLFLHLDPDALPNDFRFVKQIGGYRIYELLGDSP